MSEIQQDDAKQKLLQEIKQLKQEYLKLVDLEEEHTKQQEEINQLKRPAEENENFKLYNEFYKFLGVKCFQRENQTIKAVFTHKNVEGIEINYFVNIKPNGKTGEIQELYMPPGVDLSTLSKGYKVHEIIHKCHGYILCLEERQRQFNKLLEKVIHLNNCWISKDSGLLNIIIGLNLVKDVNTNKVHNLELQLRYKPDEIYPSQMIIDPVVLNSETMIKEATREDLLQFFANPFKHLELCDAIDEIIDKEKKPFIWDSTFESEILLEEAENVNESGNSSEDDFWINIKKKRKQKSKTGNRKKIKKDVNKQKSKDNEEEMLETSVSERSMNKSNNLNKDKSSKRPTKKKEAEIDPKQKTLNFNVSSTSKEMPKPPGKLKSTILEKYQNILTPKRLVLSLEKAKIPNRTEASFISSTPLRVQTNHPGISEVNKISPIRHVKSNVLSKRKANKKI